MVGFSDLKLFMLLAETLNFSRAAERAHMSPSALSRRMSRLEGELQSRLFERDNRSVRLTKAGVKFRRFAEQSLLDWQAISADLQKDRQVVQGTVNLFASVTATYSVLPPIMSLLRRDFPLIEIRLHTGDEAQALDRVIMGQDDVAVAAHPESLPQGLQFLTLTHSPLVFIYPSTSCFTQQVIDEAQKNATAIAWDELSFIVAERGLARRRLVNWCESRGFAPQVYAQVSGHEAIISMVGLGLGVGLVPEIVLSASPLSERVRVLHIESVIEPYAVGLVAKESRHSGVLLSALWRVAQQAFSL